MPTILDFLGTEGVPDAGPVYYLEGASLMPLIAGTGATTAPPGAVLPADAAFSEAVRLGGEQKALTTAGAKCIHDVGSGETVVYDLRADPGEVVAAADPAGSPVGSVVTAMFDAIFEMTETWHIEIDGGGVAHAFEIAAAPGEATSTGEIYLARAMTADGRVRPIAGPRLEGASPPGIDIKGLRVSDRLHLAFKATPRKFPVEFRFSVDGKSAQAITYLGEGLVRPSEMPFVQAPGREACKSRGQPPSRPVPPYILVWLGGEQVGDETTAHLSDQAKQQLRALGYLQ